MAKLTPKSLQTRQAILDSACELFSTKWYETVSVPDISRHAGKSSGAYYNYFKNKEEIFLFLLEQFLEIFEREMEGISGASLEERLQSFMEITIGSGRKYKSLVSIFREGQYRYTEMENRLRDIYSRALMVVFGRDLSESEFLYVTGPVRFISIRSLYHKRPYDMETMKHLLLKGVFADSDIDSMKVFAPVELNEREEPENTRDILLGKAEELFGELGYHQVNVYDITRQSRFAVGTFYRHFDSKEKILIDLVARISRKTRSLVSQYLGGDLNPLEQTMRGFYVFVKLFEKYPAYYKIIREAEFVIEKSVEDYYNKFESGYLKQQYPDTLDPVTLANAFSGMAHYFGIEDIFSGNITDIKKGLMTLGCYLQRGIPMD